jgi:hypothetical protein
LEFNDLVFSEYTKFNVTDIEDYHVKGTFNSNAACDTEFYGYRETAFRVSSAKGKDSIGWWSFDEDELQYFANKNDDRITLIVQNAIDKQNGEF